MKHYEIVFLVHPDQSDQVPAMTKRITSIVKDAGGKVHRNENWRRRQLAYPIAKVHKAHYLLMNVECTFESMDQIREYFRFNEAVLRHLILSVDRAITRPSPVKPTEMQDEAEITAATKTAAAEMTTAAAEMKTAAADEDDVPAVVDEGAK